MIEYLYIHINIYEYFDRYEQLNVIILDCIKVCVTICVTYYVLTINNKYERSFETLTRTFQKNPDINK